MATEVMTAPEGRIIHKTYAVLSGAAIPQRVHVTQYDESLPVIACTLYKDGQLYTIPDGASVRLRMNKNGLPVYHEAIGIDDARHVVYLEITAQMTVLYGEFAMVLEVETSDGKTAGTSYLRLIVRQNPVQNPELDNIPDYTANSNKLTAEGVKKLQDESSTQQKAIEDKGKNTLESIPEDYSALSGKVDKNTSGISELKEDISGICNALKKEEIPFSFRSFSSTKVTITENQVGKIVFSLIYHQKIDALIDAHPNGFEAGLYLMKIKCTAPSATDPYISLRMSANYTDYQEQTFPIGESYLFFDSRNIGTTSLILKTDALGTITIEYEMFKLFGIESLSDGKNGVVTIAANDSTLEAKANADYVCTGTNDQGLINEIIANYSGKSLKLYFRNGTYNLTTLSLNESKKWYFLNIKNSFVNVSIEGEQKPHFDYETNKTNYISGINGGVIFKVASSAVSSLDATNEICVIKSEPLNSFPKRTVTIKNIGVVVPDNTHQFIALDLSNNGSADVEDFYAFVDVDNDNIVPPTAESIGIRGLNISQNVPYRMSRCFVYGFNIGFDFDGEHLYATECSALYCNYSYYFARRFGCYHINTLMHCNEERCIRSICIGEYADGSMCNIISHDIEYMTDGDFMNVQKAKELSDTYGSVSYAVTRANVGSVERDFWEDGSGEQYETYGNKQKRKGTTANRPLYPSPNFKYFDTTLNKLIMFVNNNWVDSFGAVV